MAATPRARMALALSGVCRRAASSHTSSLPGHSSQPLVISLRASARFLRAQRYSCAYGRHCCPEQCTTTSFACHALLQHEVLLHCKATGSCPSSKTRGAPGDLLQARGSDPAGRVLGVGADDALQQHARLLDVADLRLAGHLDAVQVGQVALGVHHLRRRARPSLRVRDVLQRV